MFVFQQARNISACNFDLVLNALPFILSDAMRSWCRTTSCVQYGTPHSYGCGPGRILPYLYGRIHIRTKTLLINVTGIYRKLIDTPVVLLASLPVLPCWVASLAHSASCLQPPPSVVSVIARLASFFLPLAQFACIRPRSSGILLWPPLPTAAGVGPRWQWFGLLQCRRSSDPSTRLGRGESQSGASAVLTPTSPASLLSADISHPLHQRPVTTFPPQAFA